MNNASVSAIAAGACSALLLLAGVLKAVDLPAFVDILRSWESLPQWGPPVIGSGLPFFEIVLGVLWLAGVGRKRVAILSAALVAASVTASLIESQANPAASCGCFGKFLVRAQSLESLGVKLAMGGGMIGSWLWYARVGSVSGRKTLGVDGQRKSSPSEAEGRGFTLVEILVVVVIIGLLVGIVAVALAGARGQAKQAAGLSTLRSHGQALASYCRDAGGVFPYFTVPAPGVIDLAVPELGTTVKAGYFDASCLWHLVLAEPYYGVKWSHESFQPRGSLGWSDPKQRLYAGYWYSCTFLALPDYWDDDRWRRPPAQLAAIREAQVVFPSDKALVIDSFSCRYSTTDLTRDLDLPVETVFVDGSAAAIAVNERGLSATSHRTDEQWGQFSMVDRLPGMHTIKGVAGRDRQRVK